MLPFGVRFKEDVRAAAAEEPAEQAVAAPRSFRGPG